MYMCVIACMDMSMCKYICMCVLVNMCACVFICMCACKQILMIQNFVHIMQVAYIHTYAHDKNIILTFYRLAPGSQGSGDQQQPS